MTNERPCQAIGESTASGLQKSMRFLLQVIAGLLLSEFVTKSVMIYHGSLARANILVLAAAGAFLFRLFVDNLLFYEESDRNIDSGAEYVMRLFLLAVDLASYVVCYDIVVRLSRLAEHPSHQYTYVLIQQVMYAIALVEAFHFLWSVGALVADRTWGDKQSTERFVRWMACSGGTGVAMTVVASWFVPGVSPDSAAIWFAVISAGSLLAYLSLMQSQYRKVVR